MEGALSDRCSPRIMRNQNDRLASLAAECLQKHQNLIRGLAIEVPGRFIANQ